MKSQHEDVPHPGHNHTGIALHPEYAAEMLEGAAEFGPTSGGGPQAIADNRIRAARASAPVATMPPELDLPVEMVRLLDKLGARLQFERMGTRLYEALISKLDAYGSFAGGPTRTKLQQIRDEEHGHMQLAHALIMKLGGDPTVVTPCANLQAVASRGIGDLLVDPRTTLIECLEAMLVAELTDQHSWNELAALVAEAEPALEAEVRQAEQTELRHLAMVRGWIEAAGRLRVDVH